MSHYLRKFDSRVAGIPCIIGIAAYCPRIPARYSYSFGNSYGIGPEEPAHVDFEVLDRNGRRAQWLERKLDHDEETRIIEEALEEMSDD